MVGEGQDAQVGSDTEEPEKLSLANLSKFNEEQKIEESSHSVDAEDAVGEESEVMAQQRISINQHLTHNSINEEIKEENPSE